MCAEFLPIVGCKSPIECEVPSLVTVRMIGTSHVVLHAVTKNLTLRVQVTFSLRWCSCLFSLGVFDEVVSWVERYLKSFVIVIWNMFWMNRAPEAKKILRCRYCCHSSGGKPLQADGLCF